MKKKAYVLWAAAVVIFITAGFFLTRMVQKPVPIADNQSRSDIISNEPKPVPMSPDSGITETPVPVPSNEQPQKTITPQMADPLPNALSRITKKPFGIFVTPKNSPVQPERFTGYHNAVDLETTAAEQNVDVPVKALCDGKVLLARFASGYGGVAVESCTLDGQAVTVIYGHIRLASMTAKVGDEIKAGDFLANLGKGYSSETDGERKHLHLGIHKGTGINILGYVQSQAQLAAWLDGAKYLQ